MTKSEFNFHSPPPLLIVISGPSGVGKDSVVQAMIARGLPFHFVVTTTDRLPRENEVEGRDYFFVSEEKFARMVENDEFFEHAKVYENHKGTTRKQIQNAMASGQDVVMRVDVQGAATVREKAPEAVLVFLTTQSERELVERLKARRTDAEKDLRLRIATAQQELKRVAEFDYVVVNADGQLNKAVDTVIAIIRAEHQRVHHRKVSL